jgi:riboflavin kinase/FMN adenylyltransferase
VKIKIENDSHNGMLYIGNRPVFDGTKKSIEVNIFDFDRDIYEKNICLVFFARIRGDMNFENVEQLKEKMKEDKINATKILS